MKKVLLIFLTCIYTFATMGCSLKQFYCCGKLKSTSFTLGTNLNEKCKIGSEKGCCENKYEFFKVKDNHISAEIVNVPFLYSTDIPEYTSIISNYSFFPQPVSINYRSHSPPLSIGVAVYLFNCVFRI